ncbi:MAG: 30S ribosomal protein S8 [Candidatus Gracilibacteria bacterium]|jgi:small subunit ribosomal protein S8
MHTDPIADLLTRIRNAVKAEKQSVSADYSKIKEQILSVMKARHFIHDFEVEGEGQIKTLRIILSEKHPGLELKRISKPGQRIYVRAEDLKPIKNGLGMAILSTSKGVMSGGEARKQKLGGEMLCEIS